MNLILLQQFILCIDIVNIVMVMSDPEWSVIEERIEKHEKFCTTTTIFSSIVIVRLLNK